MKASYQWLRELVDCDLPPHEVAHVLTMAGFEVEAMEESEGDWVLDIGVTPNRSDGLSIMGIARELSAILEKPLRDVATEIQNATGSGPGVTVHDHQLCPRYTARTVAGVTIADSPPWLVRRLEQHGIRAACNVVDITNYVLLELGQPLHAFDQDRLSGGKIEVRRASDVTRFTTLDDVERTVQPDTLLIWDGEKPVAIAGVMGGRNTEVSPSTVNVLLESAFFLPSSVRRTSKHLNLVTESSYRFERTVDINAVLTALDRAAQLIADIAGGKISNITDVYPAVFTSSPIAVALDKVNALMGVAMDKAFIEKILANLGFQTKREGDVLLVTPPSFRSDVERDVDVIEEIARIYGYDKIPSSLPVMQMRPAGESGLRRTIGALKQSMVKSGFLEVINFSFMNEAHLNSLQLPDHDPRRKPVSVRNPLRVEECAMRTTLIPALLINIATNVKRGEKILRLFETSRVFLPSNEKLPREVTQMAAVFRKDAHASIWESEHEGFYDLKGVAENILQNFKVKDLSFDREGPAAQPYLHPGKSCSIRLSGDVMGCLGCLHPAVSRSFDIHGDVTILEIYDLEKLEARIPRVISYSAVPRYPSSERDLAVIVDRNVSVEDTRRTILSADTGLIESVSLFDIYTGKTIPRDRKSLAFSIRFRASDRTLTDSEVDALHEAIIKKLKDRLNAELRS